MTPGTAIIKHDCLPLLPVWAPGCGLSLSGALPARMWGLSSFPAKLPAPPEPQSSGPGSLATRAPWLLPVAVLKVPGVPFCCQRARCGRSGMGWALGPVSGTGGDSGVWARGAAGWQGGPVLHQPLPGAERCELGSSSHWLLFPPQRPSVCRPASRFSRGQFWSRTARAPQGGALWRAAGVWLEPSAGACDRTGLAAGFSLLEGASSGSELWAQVRPRGSRADGEPCAALRLAREALGPPAH